MYSLPYEKYTHRMCFDTFDLSKPIDKYSLEGHNYIASGNVFNIAGIEFEFEQDFVDDLYIGSIYVCDKYKDEIIIDVSFKLVKDQPGVSHRFMFKLGDKKKIHFWNDVDYIVENLIERTYIDMAFLGPKRVPIAQQMADLTALALGKI